MFYKTLPLRCGSNNCKEFRSWAEPTADCCVTIPKDNKPPEIDVRLISKIKNVILDENDETIIDSHDEILEENKLMAWNVKVDQTYQKYIEFRFETSEDTRNAEPHRESGKKLKSGQGKKDKGQSKNKIKINKKKLSKNISKGTKAKGGRDTRGARKKKNVHRGKKRPRSMKKGKGGNKKKNTGENPAIWQCKSLQNSYSHSQLAQKF